MVLGFFPIEGCAGATGISRVPDVVRGVLLEIGARVEYFYDCELGATVTEIAFPQIMMKIAFTQITHNLIQGMTLIIDT